MKVTRVPPKGKAFNPFRCWPPNQWCFCGRGKRFKSCHQPLLMWFVTEKEAKHLRANFTQALDYVRNLGKPYILEKPIL